MENQNVAAGCDGTTHEPYEHEHNGFVAFQDIYTNTARCSKIALANPSGCGTVTDCSLINDLNSVSAPNFMWLTPNDCDNMHASNVCTTGNGYNGCTSGGSSSCIKGGDNYLKSLVPNILSSYAFQNQRSSLFIVFDEGTGYCPLNGSSESCLYAVWAGPVAKTSFSSSRLYNHYSLTKTIEINWNLAALTSNDAGATAMTEFFNPTSPAPDFSISSVTISPGSSNASTISLKSLGGFADTITLSTASSPPGPTLSLSSTSVTLSSGGTGTTTLTISTQSSTPNGDYTVTVTGASGSLSHSTSVLVSVRTTPDFSIAANPTSITLQPGGTSSSSITVSSLNSFSGTVTLTDSISPVTSNPPAISLSSNSLTLSSGGSAGSTLSITTTSSTTPGSYVIVVTGTSGSLSHSVSVSLTVAQQTDFSLASSSSTVNIVAGSSGTSTITTASLGGFSCTDYLSISA